MTVNGLDIHQAACWTESDALQHAVLVNDSYNTVVLCVLVVPVGQVRNMLTGRASYVYDVLGAKEPWRAYDKNHQQYVSVKYVEYCITLGFP